MWAWDEIFARPGYRFGTEPAAFITAQAPLLRRGQRALMLAEGEGRNAVWLAGQGLDVTAMDLSEVALDKARALAGARGVTVDFRKGDVLDWDWDATPYDLVAAVLIQFIGPAERDLVFDGMKRAVAPGGLILLHGFSEAQMRFDTGGPGIVENLYTRPMLKARFAGFDILGLDEYEAEVHEGTAHAGRQALIDLVARRPL